MLSSPSKNIYTGVALAILATLIWSGNFIVARGYTKEIPPVSMNFYRWFLASLIIFPFAFKQFKKEWKIIRQSWHYFFWVSLTGIALFNTLVYIGGQYTYAINLALIGTTTSPVIANILSRIFLKEKIGWYKITGMAICITGVLFLLSKGDFNNLASLRFSKGDLWVLLAAFCFAVYNTLVRKKPVAVSTSSFLFTSFCFGTILAAPFFLWELSYTGPVKWNRDLIWVMIYLSLGASVICFWIWNIAIHKLGAGRTALFGNLIPVFSSIEAVLWLGEEFSSNHVISMSIILTGLLIANLPLFFKPKAPDSNQQHHKNT